MFYIYHNKICESDFAGVWSLANEDEHLFDPFTPEQNP